MDRIVTVNERKAAEADRRRRAVEDVRSAIAAQGDVRSAIAAQGEEAPSGRQWHANLIQRAGRSTDTRPSILPTALVRAIDRTRKFRHVAVLAYDTFDPNNAEPAVRAAEKVAAGLAGAIAAYRQVVDPPA